MGSRVARFMGFPPAYFQLAMPFRSWLGVRHGTDRQTDRQTTTIIVWCPHHIGAGHKNVSAPITWSELNRQLELRCRYIRSNGHSCSNLATWQPAGRRDNSIVYGTVNVRPCSPRPPHCHTTAWNGPPWLATQKPGQRFVDCFQRFS